MAKKNKPLLQEGTVRRMMKLANMDALGDGFISEKYSPISEQEEELGEQELQEQDEEGDVGEPLPTPVEDEVGDEGEEALDVDMELGAEEEGLEGEITITDEEAQDIIDLAAKLETAVGGGEEELGGEEEFGAEEEPAGGEEFDMGIDVGGEEEEALQESLYEAALQGLNINLVDDQAPRRQAVIQEVKKRIYERVVNRLINENQNAQGRRSKRRRRKR